MEENKKNVGENTSSGAEKVKTVEKTVRKSPARKSVKEKTNEQTRIKTAKNNAVKKDERALAKAEKKDKRHERKMQAKEKAEERKALLKENARKRKAEKAARRDMLRTETATEKLARVEREKKARAELKTKNAERRHELALKRREAKLKKREAALADKQKRREERTKRRATRQHAPGFGGWLAAVISLGSAALIMAVIITAGAMNMVRLNGSLSMAGMSNVYELDSVADNIHSSLSKLRVSSSKTEQSKLLTDILVQSSLAENDLERIPICADACVNMTGFVNKTSDFARESLDKISRGESLSESDKQTISYLYDTNTKLRMQLDEMTVSMTEKDMAKLLDGKKGNRMGDTFSKMENNTIETPKSIFDGPFAEQSQGVNAKGLTEEKITSADGAESIFSYFKDYNLTEVDYTGETKVNDFSCFNYMAFDGEEHEFFIQLSEKGGKPVMFNSFEACDEHNFDEKECVAIAQEFLNSLGFENMKAVWTSVSGTTADVNFVTEEKGVIVYSDMVKVKVCETKGKVVGMEAFAYWLNHSERKIAEAELSAEQAQGKLNSSFEVKSSRLCLIPIDKQEKLAYEFGGSYGGEEYYVYLDAVTGEELQVFTVVNSDSGRMLM